MVGPLSGESSVCIRWSLDRLERMLSMCCRCALHVAGLQKPGLWLTVTLIAQKQCTLIS